jgi:toxin YoeB
MYSMNLEFTEIFKEQLKYWHKNNAKIVQKIVSLVSEISKAPFSGTGKPEPLKYELSGCWSRRINKEHRIVYRVNGDTVQFLSCRYHYELSEL